MNVFSTQLEREIAPLLRGLTFDGKKGLIVRRSDGKAVDLNLGSVRAGDSIAEAVGRWSAQLDVTQKSDQNTVCCVF